MSIKCPECEFINRDNALVCEECGHKFLDLNIKEDIFFPYRKGDTFIKKDVVIENDGGSTAIVQISSDTSLLLFPSEMEIGQKSKTTLPLSINTKGLDPDLPFQGNLTLTVKGKNFTITRPILFGRPPEPDIQPDLIQLGDVFKNKAVKILFSIGNKQSGSLPFLGYMGDLIGVVDFDSPKAIQKGKRESVEIILNTTEMSLGAFQTQIIFLFEDGIGDVTINVTGNVVEGPQLNGEIAWYTMIEELLNNDVDDYKYSKSVTRKILNNNVNGPINIDLGTIPQKVRSKIQLQFSNPSKSGYEYRLSMVISNETNGILVGFSEKGEKQINIDMSVGQTFRSYINVETKELGSQNFRIKLLYDKKDYGLPDLNFDVVMDVTNLKDSNKWFGIDFGTTNSCISYFGDTEACPIEMEEDYDESISYLYSFCCFQDKKNMDVYYVGRYAENQAVSVGSIGIKSIKTKLGTEWSKNIGGRTYKAKEIAGIILSELVARTRDHFGLQPCNAIITVPANSSLKKIEDTIEAYRLAGINVSPNNVIYEPEAVAYYYLLSLEGKKKLKEIGDKPYHILTFDFGGGTLDISIIEVQKTGDQKFNIKVLKSIAENLGGDDLDWEIRHLAVNQAIDKNKIQTDERDLYDKRISQSTIEIPDIVIPERLALMRLCESMKKRSSRDVANLTAKVCNPLGIALPLLGKFVDVVIERKSYDNVCMKAIVEKSQKFIQQALQSVNDNKKELPEEDIDIELVVMAGGSSSIPLIQNMIHNTFDKSVVEWLGDKAKTSVSIGAVNYQIERQVGSMFKFSKVEPKTDARIGYMSFSIEHGRTFKEIFSQGTVVGTKSKTFEKVIPESGTYAIILAKNRGQNDGWDQNPDIERISQRSFHELNVDDKIIEWFELEKNGNISWYINHEGKEYKITSEVTDKPLPGSDDPGF